MQYSYILILQKVIMLYSGAEAHIFESTFFGLPVLVKQRIPKNYRHKTLDLQIRKARNSREVKLLSFVKKLGVLCPTVYYVGENYFFMNKINGKLLRESTEVDVLTLLGKQIAMMHASGVFHGDLTTANVLVSNGLPYIIDFGLGGFSHDVEDKSIDLLLMKRSLNFGFDTLINAYIQNYEDLYESKKIVSHISEVEKRARYVQR